MAQETTGSDATAGPESGVPTAPPAKEMTRAERDELASQLVDRLALWSGAAGLIPVGVIDFLAVGGVQLYMLRRLSEIYGVPFSKNLGKSILASLSGTIVPYSTASTAFSLFKFVPVIGTAVGPLTMAGISMPATWVIGKVFIQHFASGGTLLDFNPPDYREFIKAQREKLGMRSATPVPTAEATAPPTKSPASPVV